MSENEIVIICAPFKTYLNPGISATASEVPCDKGHKTVAAIYEAASLLRGAVIDNCCHCAAIYFIRSSFPSFGPSFLSFQSRAITLFPQWLVNTTYPAYKLHKLLRKFQFTAKFCLLQ